MIAYTMTLRATFLVLLVIFTTSVMSAQVRIAAGPMVGHVDMREARLWVQTTGQADVVFEVEEATGTNARLFRTRSIRATRTNQYTVTAIADSVEPGKTYTYRVVIDGVAQPLPYPAQFRTQPIWKWRSNDLPSATMMIGSCFYVNETGYERQDTIGTEMGYGSGFEILDAMTKARPDVMVWLGDNVYLREPDWNSRSGILKRFSHTRAFPPLQPFLASTAHYAIWDDHDFGPNNSNRSFWGKDNALEAHTLFWPNPSYGVGGKPGITSTFELLDVQVFLLDDRYYRVPENMSGGEQTILGEHQVQWLLDALSSSTSTFKIVAVGSQFLSTDTTKESFIHVPAERQRIIDHITQHKISGVIFITGDVHGAELSKLDRAGSYPLYDFTSSAITAGSNKNIAKQPNTLRVDGTAFGGHNYGTITVSGRRRERALTLRLFDEQGKEVWTRTLSERDLR
ncbi:MAG: alkaline phosphatase family protein [Ignavibacteriae bacterium]|nr:MAG: alkaline phosphatase family protein [Ignavibacteriota bacterium]